jgi:ATP-binding cassette subfamily F protein 3
MLLRPANTLLLDEPTNHLDMDSKDVLLDALEDFGGTLILVSHDRYFIDKLATKVIDVGSGAASVYPGGYEEYRWSLAKREEEAAAKAAPVKAVPIKSAPVVAKVEPRKPTSGGRSRSPRPSRRPRRLATAARPAPGSRGPAAQARAKPSKADRDAQATIAEREATMKSLEATMNAPVSTRTTTPRSPLISTDADARLAPDAPLGRIAAGTQAAGR